MTLLEKQALQFPIINPYITREKKKTEMTKIAPFETYLASDFAEAAASFSSLACDVSPIHNFHELAQAGIKAAEAGKPSFVTETSKKGYSPTSGSDSEAE